MQYKEKRMYRKLASIFEKISIVIIILLIISFIIGVIAISSSIAAKQGAYAQYVIPSFCIFGLILIIGCTSLIIATHFKDKLLKYKNEINDYRQFRMFLIILELVQQDKINEAIALYNSCLKSDDKKDFLHAYILASECKCNDFKIMERGQKDLGSYISSIEPEFKHLKS